MIKLWSKFMIQESQCQAILAQSVERVAFNHVVVGSIPINDDGCYIMITFLWTTMGYRYKGFITQKIEHWSGQKYIKPLHR